MNAMVSRHDDRLAPAIDVGALMAEVITKGDLAKLTPEQRVSYYLARCESAGLDPASRPFDYILLNGKLVLYANRGATDQLRGIHRVSPRIVNKEETDGIYIVTVEATTPDGRADTDIGAVAIKGLQGEARANAMMKAITKAKRRVTLSLFGLNMLDETEIDSVPSARPVSVNVSTGEIMNAPPPVALTDRRPTAAPIDHETGEVIDDDPVTASEAVEAAGTIPGDEPHQATIDTEDMGAAIQADFLRLIANAQSFKELLMIRQKAKDEGWATPAIADAYERKRAAFKATT